ncbi:MAG TPA: hypothetical protein VFD82_24735 [Planctomycetota bacterium]|nr:hypothetical protein [Planctomycetota bacterium]
MKRNLLICVAALLGVAVSAPAQIAIEGKLGNLVRGSVVLGHDHYHGHGHNHGYFRISPVRRAPVRGHWETRCEQVLVPGYWCEEHVPPTYGWIWDHCGHRHWGIVDAGGCRRVWVPARWETKTRRVWVTC